MKEKSYTLYLLRIIACFLIIWNHTSGHLLNGAYNKWSWANTGVQIFFFMSGYLYGGRKIFNKESWIKKQVRKLAVPYWTYMAIILPVIYIMDKSRLSIGKIVAALTMMQGFSSSFTVEGLGQHWFISYILLCYFLVVLFLDRVEMNVGGGTWWIRIIGIVLAGQLLSIPAAFLMQFKIAYIYTFVFGYVYRARYLDGTKEKEKRILETIIFAMAIFGFIVRYFTEGLELYGFYENIRDLLRQYVKLFWGSAAVILFMKLLPDERWEKVSLPVKEKIVYLAGITYEIYIVHEFFTCDIYTHFFEVGTIWKIIIAWTSIAIGTFVLCHLEKIWNRIWR